MTATSPKRPRRRPAGSLANQRPPNPGILRDHAIRTKFAKTEPRPTAVITVTGVFRKTWMRDSHAKRRSFRATARFCEGLRMRICVVGDASRVSSSRVMASASEFQRLFFGGGREGPRRRVLCTHSRHERGCANARGSPVSVRVGTGGFPVAARLPGPLLCSEARSRGKDLSPSS